MFRRLLFLLTILGPTVADTQPSRDQWCFLSCQLAVGSVKFSGTPSSLSYYAYRCENALLLQSNHLCAKQYCSSAEYEAGVDYQKAVCKAQGLPFLTSFLNAPHNTTNVPIVSFNQSKSRQTTAIIPSSDYYGLAYRTISVNQKTSKAHLDYCYALFMFWGILLGLASLGNLMTYLKHRGNLLQNRLPSRMTLYSRLVGLIKAYLVYPATISLKCAEPAFGCTIPPRLETIIIASFIVINVILCAVTYEVFPNNLYYPQIDAQAWRVFSDRTGYLSYANLSLLWVFGVRNNILIALTGWGYGTFSRFHRWVARMAVLQAVLHSIGYTVYAFLNGGYKGYAYDFLQEYWYTGVIATITISLLLPFSVPYIRQRFYDAFVAIHIVLALVTLVNLFYHTKIFSGEFDGFLWACVGVWALDRVLRIARIIWTHSTAHGLIHAHADWTEDEGLLRLDLTDALSRWKGPSPSGRAFFIYVISSNWRTWSLGGHPFTVVQWTERIKSPVTNVKLAQTDRHLSVSKEITSPSRSDVSSDTRTCFSLLIRPHYGLTAHLLHRAKFSVAPSQLRLLLEGPYGSAPSFRNFDTVFFIVGGSGISVAISAIYRLLNSNPKDNGTPVKAHLVWAAKTRAIIDGILNRELAYAAESDRLSVDCFVTGEDPAKDSVALRSVDEKQLALSMQSGKTPHSCSIRFGRPSVGNVIRDASSEDNKRLGVVGCGPGSLMDDVRAAVVDCQKAGRNVGMFLEEFGW